MRNLHFARILDEQIAMLLVVLLNLRVGGLHMMRAEFVVKHFLDHHHHAPRSSVAVSGAPVTGAV